MIETTRDHNGRMEPDPITVYALPVCSKSRAVQSLLAERGVAFAVRDYVADPLTGDELRALLAALPGPPVDLVRSSAGRDVDPADVADVVAHLLAHPEDMQRPVVRRGTIAVIARPPESALAFFGVRSAP